MFTREILGHLRIISGLLVASSMLAAGQTTFTGGLTSGNTPGFVHASTTKNLGPEDPSKVIEVSVWLTVHNRAGLDSLYQSLYDPNSSRYHSWVTHAEFTQSYAPTAAEAAQISTYLNTRGLKVVSVGPDNMFVRAQGTVGTVSKAFQVALNQYQVNGQVYRANADDPIIQGPTAALVRSVSGLDNAAMVHPFMQATPKNAKTSSGLPLTAADAGSGLFQSNCFTGPTTETNGAGQYPYAVFKGNKYNSGVTGCGYTPDEIQTAYNLKALYKEGYDGTGQTIVIIDWCGSPTILSDANAFSARFGLPPLTNYNFHIVNYPGPSFCSAPDPEINIDVEWAHAIAPGANITLLVPPSNSFQDIDEAQYYAIVGGLGSVTSGSYGAPEFFVAGTELLNQNLIAEIGAIFGVSLNYATGDYGDFTQTYGFQTVNAPADSQYATAVGGVSLALNANHSIKWQSGWGTVLNPLAGYGYVYDPPYFGYFYGGSGGGASAFFSKPGYQQHLAGYNRQLPDISWLADPSTGGIITITESGVYPPQILEVYGGTSLACPMFSALWAIANQEAGFPLGQAAPYLYYMSKGTITDILPVGSSTNVTDWVYVSPTQIDKYAPSFLAEPLYNTKAFYSAIWDYPLSPGTVDLITFGTDTSLVTGPGWDNVTGLGVPNGKAFADYFNPASPK